MNELVKKAADLAQEFGSVVEGALILNMKKEPIPANFYDKARRLRDSVNEAFQAIPAEHWESKNRALELSGTYVWGMYRIAERAVEETNRNFVPFGVSGLQKLTPIVV